MNIETDIVVVGTGPAGLMAALYLANAGFSIVLAGPPANLADRRTTALMKPSLDFLQRLDILERIKEDAAPLKVMRIVDATNRLLRSPLVTFRAAEIGEDLFGLNIPNKHLVGVLVEKVMASESIKLVPQLVKNWSLTEHYAEAEMDSGTTIRAKLVVAADGRFSPAREAAGIKVSVGSTGQSALVLNFSHTRAHDFVSTEFHTPYGPFTQVPLPGMRSSLVWVTRPSHAQELSKLDDLELSSLIEEKMQSMLGRVTVETGRQIYPLTSAMPRRFAQNRVVLVGEAAHIFPPIGAQGLNLSIRDIESLAGIVNEKAEDPGSQVALAEYDRIRRPDIIARSSAVNLLNRSLLSDMLPVQFARTMGLGLLGALPPLRSFFMREGLRTGNGFKSLFHS